MCLYIFMHLRIYKRSGPKRSGPKRSGPKRSVDPLVSHRRWPLDKRSVDPLRLVFITKKYVII